MAERSIFSSSSPSSTSSSSSLEIVVGGGSGGGGGKNLKSDDDETTSTSVDMPIINGGTICSNCNNNLNNKNGHTMDAANDTIQSLTRNKNEWIKLNVGGKYFQTTRTTLCSDRNSFFFSLCQEGSLNSEKDENGAYLIDRDPSYFAPILNFLRHGKLILNKDLNEEGVLEEAEFYNITSLIKLLKQRNLDNLNRNGDTNKNHVYRLLHCCEGELSLAISTLSDGWKFEQLVPNSPTYRPDYFVVVSRENPVKR